VSQRHDLTSMKHRLKALEAKAADEGILLTEAQIIALSRHGRYILGGRTIGQGGDEFIAAEAGDKI
jgi:hypothetical protein